MPSTADWCGPCSISYRLLPQDFEYIINHSEAKVVCVHSDYIEAVKSIRGNLSNVEFFVALEAKIGLIAKTLLQVNRTLNKSTLMKPTLSQ